MEDLLARTTIRAPYSGVVVERLMTPGERVIEGSNVVRLVDQANLEVIARAPLEYMPFVRRGQRLNLRGGELAITGTVRTVVAVGSEDTHQFELRLDLDGQPFPVGQTLRVSIPLSGARQALTVPRDALVLRPGGQSVFVVDANNEARQVSVEVGVGQGDDIEVLGAIAPGDRVVIRGNERLQPGQALSLMNSEFVHEQARRLAAAVKAAHTKDREAVSRINSDGRVFIQSQRLITRQQEAVALPVARFYRHVDVDVITRKEGTVAGHGGNDLGDSANTHRGNRLRLRHENSDQRG